MSGRPYLTLFGEGQPGVLTHGNGVYPATLNAEPSAAISGPSSTYANVEETYSASNSTDPNGSIVAYEWEFGDGATATGETVTHAYPNTGETTTYTLSLTVSDDRGATDTATVDVTIKEDYTQDREVYVPLDEDPLAPEEDSGGTFVLNGDAQIVSDADYGRSVMETAGSGYVNWDGYTWKNQGSNDQPFLEGTMSWWVKPTEPSSETFYLADQTGKNQYFRYEGGNEQFRAQGKYSGWTHSATPFSAGEWTHIVFRHDGRANGNTRLYFDGEPVHIGNQMEYSKQEAVQLCKNMDGRWANFRCYDNFLSDSAVQTIYELEKP